jgi:hypothetical protein
LQGGCKVKRLIIFLSVFFLLSGLSGNGNLGKATLEVPDLCAQDSLTASSFDSNLDNTQVVRPQVNLPGPIRLAESLLIKVESLYVLKMIHSCHQGHSGGIPW